MVSKCEEEPEYQGMSAQAAIVNVLSEFQFKPWKFLQISPAEWDSLQKLVLHFLFLTVKRMVFDEAAKELLFSKPEDWYSITKEQLQEIGLDRFVDFHFKGGFISVHLCYLSSSYPRGNNTYLSRILLEDLEV